MNNTKNKLFALATITTLISVSLFLLRTGRGKQKADQWRKNRSVYLEVAHDITEGAGEELEGLKNRLVSSHWKDKKYFSSQKAAV